MRFEVKKKEREKAPFLFMGLDLNRRRLRLAIAILSQGGEILQKLELKLETKPKDEKRITMILLIELLNTMKSNNRNSVELYSCLRG